MEFSVTEILQWRDVFLDAYMRSIDEEITIDQFSIYYKNKYLDDLRSDMRSVLNLAEYDPVLSFGTFKKLFFPTKTENFNTSVCNIINRYIAAVNLKLKEKGDKIIKEDNNVFQGALLINQEFKNIAAAKIKRLQPIKFYTTKLDPDYQWAGVIGGLDYPRSELTVIKIEVLQAFNYESKVCAVICGPSGCGKSTFLRRLALDLVKSSLKILWINNLKIFFESDLVNIANNDEKYLIIIEDWTSIESNIPLVDSFFSAILNVKNVRIIVGDIDSNKKYREYLYGKNVFELEAKENENIILHILSNTEEWAGLTLNLFEKKDIYKAPLFLILFVIARISPKGDSFNLDPDDFISSFNKIIINDLRKLYQEYPGLAQALYHWSCLHIEYDLRITWEAFLKLADHFNNNNKPTRRLACFTNNNPICKLLSHYFSLRKLLPPKFKNKNVFYFHHDLLATGLTIPINENWNTDINVKLEILETLYQNKEYEIAYDLAKAIDRELESSEQVFESEAFFVLYLHNSFRDKVLDNDRMLAKYYYNAPIITDQKYWIKALLFIGVLFDPDWDPKDTMEILKNLIDYGCKAQCIIEASNLDTSNSVWYDGAYGNFLEKWILEYKKNK